MFLTPEERARFEAEMASEADSERRAEADAKLLVAVAMVSAGVAFAALAGALVVYFATR